MFCSIHACRSAFELYDQISVALLRTRALKFVRGRVLSCVLCEMMYHSTYYTPYCTLTITLTTDFAADIARKAWRYGVSPNNGESRRRGVWGELIERAAGIWY